MRCRALIAIAVVLLAGACGGGNEIGGDLETDGTVQGGEGAIGQATTTTTAPAAVTTTAPRTATTAKSTATTAPVPDRVYKIQDDEKGQYIEPLHHTVRANGLVRFVNDDDIAHRITLKIGSTAAIPTSPPIAPGTYWDVRPTTRGNYDIVDEERTYAVGATLTVTA